MRFNSVAYGEDIAVVPEPLRTLGAKAEALKAQTNTGLAMVVGIWFFVAFLASDSARVTSRLSAHGTLAFGRSGPLR